MATGRIIRLVNTYGSSWGIARPDREPRQVFFNAASLIDETEFSSLLLGDAVEFDEELDRANGMRAINLRRLAKLETVPVALSDAGEQGIS